MTSETIFRSLNETLEYTILWAGGMAVWVKFILLPIVKKTKKEKGHDEPEVFNVIRILAFVVTWVLGWRIVHEVVNFLLR